MAGLCTAPFRVPVPTFGEWGFIIGSPDRIGPLDGSCLPGGLSYPTPDVLPTLFVWSPDLAPLSLDTHAPSEALEAVWARETATAAGAYVGINLLADFHGVAEGRMPAGGAAGARLMAGELKLLVGFPTRLTSMLRFILHDAAHPWVP